MIIQRDRYLNRLIRRMGTENVKIVTGIRRCGKSFLLLELFRRHLLSTGVPEVHIISVKLDSADYLIRLVRDVYLLDIEDRYTPERADDLREIMNTLFSGIGSLSNLKEISDTLRTVKGSGISYETVSKYIDMLEEAFLFEKCKRYDVKGNRYIGSPFKYYASDVGVQNAHLDFRQIERPHIMENIIFNELRSRGYNVDVGIATVRTTESGKQVQVQTEIDFVVNLADHRYYIQSAYSVDDPEKREHEVRPLRNLKDGFRRILVRGDDCFTFYDDDGILNVNVIEFLTNPDVMNLRGPREVGAVPGSCPGPPSDVYHSRRTIIVTAFPPPRQRVARPVSLFLSWSA